MACISATTATFVDSGFMIAQDERDGEEHTTRDEEVQSDVGLSSKLFEGIEQQALVMDRGLSEWSQAIIIPSFVARIVRLQLVQ